MQEQQVAKIEVGDGAAIPNPEDQGLVSAWWIALVGTVSLLVLLPLRAVGPSGSTTKNFRISAGFPVASSRFR